MKINIIRMVEGKDVFFSTKDMKTYDFDCVAVATLNKDHHFMFTSCLRSVEPLLADPQVRITKPKPPFIN